MKNLEIAVIGTRGLTQTGEKNMYTIPSFTANIKSNGSLFGVYSCPPQQDGQLCVFLAHMGDKYYAYDFSRMQFDEILPKVYRALRVSHRYIEIEHPSIDARHQWNQNQCRRSH